MAGAGAAAGRPGAAPSADAHAASGRLPRAAELFRLPMLNTAARPPAHAVGRLHNGMHTGAGGYALRGLGGMP